MMGEVLYFLTHEYSDVLITCAVFLTVQIIVRYFGSREKSMVTVWFISITLTAIVTYLVFFAVNSYYNQQRIFDIRIIAAFVLTFAITFSLTYYLSYGVDMMVVYLKTGFLNKKAFLIWLIAVTLLSFLGVLTETVLSFIERADKIV